ncbi:MAG: anti-sigma factor family protein [Nitriliruptoraceae bacterium]
MAPSSHVHPATLWSLAAGELCPEQRSHVRSHLAACSCCAAEFERKRAVDRLLRDSATVEIPAAVRRRLETTITQLGGPAGGGLQPGGPARKGQQARAE